MRKANFPLCLVDGNDNEAMGTSKRRRRLQARGEFHLAEWVQWFFDGLGTELISLAGGLIIGFRVGRRTTKFTQAQEAGVEAEQYQKGKSIQKSKRNNAKAQDVMSTFFQKQKAGDRSKQTQIGGQDNA